MNGAERRSAELGCGICRPCAKQDCVHGFTGSEILRGRNRLPGRAVQLSTLLLGNNEDHSNS